MTTFVLNLVYNKNNRVAFSDGAESVTHIGMPSVMWEELGSPQSVKVEVSAT